MKILKNVRPRAEFFWHFRPRAEFFWHFRPRAEIFQFYAQFSNWTWKILFKDLTLNIAALLAHPYDIGLFNFIWGPWLTFYGKRFHFQGSRMISSWIRFHLYMSVLMVYLCDVLFSPILTSFWPLFQWECLPTHKKSCLLSKYCLN